MFDGRAWRHMKDGEKVVSPERAAGATIVQDYGLLSGGFECGALEDNGGVDGACESGQPFSWNDTLRFGLAAGEDRQG